MTKFQKEWRNDDSYLLRLLRYIVNFILKNWFLNDLITMTLYLLNKMTLNKKMYCFKLDISKKEISFNFLFSREKIFD